MTSGAREYYDAFDKRLLLDFIRGNARVESAIRFACDFLKKAGTDRVLDLGFGAGWSSYEFSRAVGTATITGIDLSDELTKLATAMFGSEPRLQFVQQDLTDPTWLDDVTGQFDAIVMIDVYEHIPQSIRPAFHNAIDQVLSEKGLVVLTCPTVLHQDYLRQRKPEGLQPIDEDVTVDHLQQLADRLSGELAHFEYKSIFRKIDYFHAVIARDVGVFDSVTRPHSLLGGLQRSRFLTRAAPIVGNAVVREIRKQQPSVARRAVRKLRKLFAG